MIATGLALLALALAALPAALAAVNLRLYRPLPPAAGALPAVSVLIPARNEAARIAPALRSVLASEGVTFELLVLDDHSEDETAAIVAAHAARDPRLRLLSSAPLPPGWTGKQHACAQLGRAARHELLLFMDADVRLAPDAVARMAAQLERGRAALLSGFPREITGSLLEHLVIPLIHWLLLGFLPLWLMRRRRDPAFGAACGQLIMVRRRPYRAAGGHGAIRSSRHDGLTLPRALRRQGHMTELCDATDLAVCRMYEGARETWQGFAKNATEGMATRALPLWTLLLAGGQVLPLALVLHGAGNGMSGLAWLASLSALVLAFGPRLAFAVRFRQSWLGAALHPLGVLLVLAIQWQALIQGRRRPVA